MYDEWKTGGKVRVTVSGMISFYIMDGLDGTMAGKQDREGANNGGDKKGDWKVRDYDEERAFESRTIALKL